MTHPFFTIAHSTRSTSELVDLLCAAEVELVVDIRTVPRSRANPQFNRDTLPITLSEFAIDYEHISALGGFERTTLFSQSTRILVDAMKAAGVKRLIAVTGLGVVTAAAMAVSSTTRLSFPCS